MSLDCSGISMSSSVKCRGLHVLISLGYFSLSLSLLRLHPRMSIISHSVFQHKDAGVWGRKNYLEVTGQGKMGPIRVLTAAPPLHANGPRVSLSSESFPCLSGYLYMCYLVGTCCTIFRVFWYDKSSQNLSIPWAHEHSSNNQAMQTTTVLLFLSVHCTI